VLVCASESRQPEQHIDESRMNSRRVRQASPVLSTSRVLQAASNDDVQCCLPGCSRGGQRNKCLFVEGQSMADRSWIMSFVARRSGVHYLCPQHTAHYRKQAILLIGRRSNFYVRPEAGPTVTLSPLPQSPLRASPGSRQSSIPGSAKTPV
jgi:hypothetical protein